MNGKKIAIIGGGPIGLEAAVAARSRGFDVELFERGQVADSVDHWGHVRMFSPFAMNVTKRGSTLLREAGWSLPPPEALLTGREFRESYLLPLARTQPPGTIHGDCEVLAIGRSKTLKGDYIGDVARSESPFRLLVFHGDKEMIAEADAVLDCSGTYLQPNSLGDGGIPVPGEKSAAGRIAYSIPDLADRLQLVRYANRSVLVIGGGHSAATAVIRLAELEGTRVHWLLRQQRQTPLQQISDDALPERASLTSTANRLVESGRVTLHRGFTIDHIDEAPAGLSVMLINRHATDILKVDEVVVATGFRPDLSLTRELQLQTCWATEGTYPLATTLLGEAGADCLHTPAVGVEMLKHPEPNYFTLGMKSYGRSPNFLLRTGHEQIALVLDSLRSSDQTG